VPRKCSICEAPDRAAIDAALATGGSLRATAARFGTSKSALDRHRGEQHAPPGGEAAPGTPLVAAGGPHSALVGEEVSRSHDTRHRL
jgi:hypothetical protein